MIRVHMHELFIPLPNLVHEHTKNHNTELTFHSTDRLSRNKFIKSVNHTAIICCISSTIFITRQSSPFTVKSTISINCCNKGAQSWWQLSWLVAVPSQCRQRHSAKPKYHRADKQHGSSQHTTRNTKWSQYCV